MKAIFRSLFANFSRLALLIVLAYAAYVAFSGIGKTIPAHVWTSGSAWQFFGVLCAIIYAAFSAGRESRVGRIRFWRDASEKWNAHYRHMLDVNKTMIDDVLLAQKAGVPVKTFLHGVGPNPQHDPADTEGERS
ncbi:hypothetical protein PQR05_29760 [Paraburkholderia sediminicola]|uniref:hypothetical protein n=1 Tax=Paraburkholderia sediminicola TaxID=458836 RepID=UPI0038BA1F3F